VIARRPPRLARWLVEHLASSYQREALVGDLFEEYQRGRSRLWYWRQAVLAMLYAVVRWPHGFSFLRRMTRRLLAILVVAALGVGTLTWAATTYVPSCAPPATACHEAPH
jgi:hypothetical protein